MLSSFKTVLFSQNVIILCLLFWKWNKCLNFDFFCIKQKNIFIHDEFVTSIPMLIFFFPKNVTFQIVTSLHMFEVFFLLLEEVSKWNRKMSTLKRERRKKLQFKSFAAFKARPKNRITRRPSYWKAKFNWILFRVTWL